MNSRSSESRRRLTAAEFSAGNAEHVAQLAQMGIQLQTMADGRKSNDRNETERNDDIFLQVFN